MCNTGYQVVNLFVVSCIQGHSWFSLSLMPVVSMASHHVLGLSGSSVLRQLRWLLSGYIIPAFNPFS